MMAAEKRKYRRHELGLKAKIDTGAGLPSQCVLSNISERGAHVAVNDSNKLPEQFLVLLPNHTQRWCHIVWQCKNQIGVEFIVAPNLSSQVAGVSAHVDTLDRKKARREVLIKCPGTGRPMQTGLHVATDYFAKLPDVRRFSHCRHCKVVHGWNVSEAWLADGVARG
jgi:hypothetical protein